MPFVTSFVEVRSDLRKMFDKRSTRYSEVKKCCVCAAMRAIKLSYLHDTIHDIMFHEKFVQFSKQIDDHLVTFTYDWFNPTDVWSNEYS